MKKPKFNQLRGTYAHTLRHRICLGFALAFFVGEGICQIGMHFIKPEPARAKNWQWLHYFKINPGDKKMFNNMNGEFDSEEI